MQLEKLKRNAIIGKLFKREPKQKKPRMTWAEFVAMMKRKVKLPRFWASVALNAGMYILLIGIAFIFLYPFIFMIVTSLKTNADLLDPTVGWIPRNLRFSNYSMAFSLMKFKSYIWNSLLITGVCTIGHLISCTMVGYGLARYKFKLRGPLFFLVILSIVIPLQTIMIPSYVMYINIGWFETFLPVFVPTFLGLGLKGGLFIFLARQSFLSLPKEMEEAARIDGCGFLGIFLRIVVPIARPLILVILVLSIVWHWNDFYEPSIYFKQSMQPLSSGIKTLITLSSRTREQLELELGRPVTDDDIVNTATIMAGSAMTLAPLMVMFMFLQKKFVQGIERSGLVE